MFVAKQEITNQGQAEIEAAVKAWGKSNDNLWDFAEKAAPIVGKRDGRTDVLAKRIGRSVDSVEAYAKAWKLREKLLMRYPHYAEEWLDELYIGHFVPVARKWAAGWITLTDCANYLNMAVKEHLSVDDLRTKLPSNDKTDSAKMMKSDIKYLDKRYLKAPRLNIPDDVIRAAKLLRGRLEKATK